MNRYESAGRDFWTHWCKSSSVACAKDGLFAFFSAIRAHKASGHVRSKPIKTWSASVSVIVQAARKRCTARSSVPSSSWPDARANSTVLHGCRVCFAHEAKLRPHL